MPHVDHVVVIGERHLLRILSKYVDYYNGTRTHLSLVPRTRPSRGLCSRRARAGRWRCHAWVAPSRIPAAGGVSRADA
jgi:hypothetical protein